MCHSLKSSCNYIKKVCLYCSINNTINLQCIQSAMGSYGIGAGLREVLAAHRPNAAAIEEVFHAVNAKSALRLAHVRGAAMLILAEQALAVGEYSPLTIKKSVVGNGRAEKEQVQFMMRSLLGPTAPVEQPDACDALAVAICHATHAWKAVA